MVTCTLGDSVQLQPRWSTLCFENYEYLSSGKGLPIILPGLTSIGLKRAQDSLLLVSHRARMSPSDSVPGISTHYQSATLWSHTEVSLITCQLFTECQLYTARGSLFTGYSKDSNSQNPMLLRTYTQVEERSSIIL